jgi:hypothetical protein
MVGLRAQSDITGSNPRATLQKAYLIETMGPRPPNKGRVGNLFAFGKILSPWVADLSTGDAENARPVYRISPIERGVPN